MKTVWVCVITHKYGEDISAHATEESALAEVDAYVEEWWEREMGKDAPMPEAAAERRDAYFEKTMESEFFNVEDVVLKGEPDDN
jgi:hypothetical protein